MWQTKILLRMSQRARKVTVGDVGGRWYVVVFSSTAQTEIQIPTSVFCRVVLAQVISTLKIIAAAETFSRNVSVIVDNIIRKAQHRWSQPELSLIMSETGMEVHWCEDWIEMMQVTCLSPWGMRTLSISRRQDHHRNCGETPQPSVVLAVYPEHNYYIHQGFTSRCLDLPCLSDFGV